MNSLIRQIRPPRCGWAFTVCLTGQCNDVLDTFSASRLSLGNNCLVNVWTKRHPMHWFAIDKHPSQRNGGGRLSICSEQEFLPLWYLLRFFSSWRFESLVLSQEQTNFVSNNGNVPFPLLSNLLKLWCLFVRPYQILSDFNTLMLIMLKRFEALRSNTFRGPPVLQTFAIERAEPTLNISATWAALRQGRGVTIHAVNKAACQGRDPPAMAEWRWAIQQTWPGGRWWRSHAHDSCWPTLA